MSSLQPLPPYPVFERTIKTEKTGIIIILTTIVIISIIVAIIVYAVFKSRAAKLVTRCEKDLCVITLATGVKRCPITPGEQLVYNQIFEDCTSGNYCQSPSSPCAVMANGSIDCRGACLAGNDRCNCQKAPV